MNLDNTEATGFRKTVNPSKKGINRRSWTTRDWWVWDCFDCVGPRAGIGQVVLLALLLARSRHVRKQ
jgi:hypothetical protein